MGYTRRHNRANSYSKIAQPEGHNSAQFLEAVWLPLLPERSVYHREHERPAGWYVRRTCACHEGQIVIARCYETQEAALGGVRLLVEAAMVFGT